MKIPGKRDEECNPASNYKNSKVKKLLYVVYAGDRVSGMTITAIHVKEP